MNAAMKDGVNVQGALSRLVGAEDNAKAALSSTPPAGEGSASSPSRIIQHRSHPDLPGQWRARQIRYGAWSLDVELPCINGLSAWFNVATFHAAEDDERLMTDGARQEAREYAAKFAALSTWMGGTGVSEKPAQTSDTAGEGSAVSELARLCKLSAEMAEDEGLWFVAQTAAEAYLQQELRKLCAAIEGRLP